MGLGIPHKLLEWRLVVDRKEMECDDFRFVGEVALWN